MYILFAFHFSNNTHFTCCSPLIVFGCILHVCMNACSIHEQNHMHTIKLILNIQSISYELAHILTRTHNCFISHFWLDSRIMLFDEFSTSSISIFTVHRYLFTKNSYRYECRSSLLLAQIIIEFSPSSSCFIFYFLRNFDSILSFRTKKRDQHEGKID